VIGSSGCRCSRPTTSGTRTCRARRSTHQHEQDDRADRRVNIHPDFGRASASRSPSCRRASRRSRSSSTTTATRAIRAVPVPRARDVQGRGDRRPDELRRRLPRDRRAAGECMVYEGYACQYNSDGWHCGQRRDLDLTKKSAGPAAPTAGRRPTRPAFDLRRARALRGGDGRRDHARRSASRCRAPATRASAPRPTRRFRAAVRAGPPRRPWACACA
jgi:hypothetical protein